MLERPKPRRRRPCARRRRGGWLKSIGRLDQRLLVALRTSGHSPATERVAAALGTFGEWGLGWVAVGGVGAALDPDRRSAWLAASLSGPAAVAINYAVKVAVGRQRPLIEGHPRLAKAPSKLSFPSAHATSSMAAATAIGRAAPGARPALYPLAGAVCLGRPFLGMHYPSDVLAGVLLGREIGRHWPLPGIPMRGDANSEIWSR